MRKNGVADLVYISRAIEIYFQNSYRFAITTPVVGLKNRSKIKCLVCVGPRQIWESLRSVSNLLEYFSNWYFTFVYTRGVVEITGRGVRFFPTPYETRTDNVYSAIHLDALSRYEFFFVYRFIENFQTYHVILFNASCNIIANNPL